MPTSEVIILKGSELIGKTPNYIEQKFGIECLPSDIFVNTFKDKTDRIKERDYIKLKGGWNNVRDALKATL